MARIHRFVLFSLYGAGSLTLIWVFSKAASFYILPHAERPFHELYRVFRPAGTWGLSLGVVGTVLMLLLLLYSVRKRFRFLRRLGFLSTWLNYHIFCGIFGPLFILLHTSFKLGGLVAVSFWSMVAVALSGVLGRYLYSQIPRSSLGNELDEAETLAKSRKLAQDIAQKREDLPLIGSLLNELTQFDRKARGIMGLIKNAIGLHSKMGSVHRKLSEHGLHGSELKRVKRRLFRKARFEINLFYLADLNKVFHYWHVIHRPFALIMYLIMIVHIGVALAFGIQVV